jgi:alpha-galactosidase
MNPHTRAVLTNREVIAVNQDRRGEPGRRVRSRNGSEVWVKPLRGRCRAVLLFNRFGPEREITVRLRSLRGVPDADRYAIRDLWAHSSSKARFLDVAVPEHGVQMFRVCPR